MVPAKTASASDIVLSLKVSLTESGPSWLSLAFASTTGREGP
jgi:hypothetical protein